MKDLIWKKDGKGESADTEMMAFLAGEDVELDKELLLFDIRASAAHVKGLQQIDILSADESARLLDGLSVIQKDILEGNRELDSSFEDGHSAIESWLTDMLGDIGGKIHTGRSRNDQVAVALRLYMKDRLKRLQSTCTQIASVLLNRIKTEGDLPMAGYNPLLSEMRSSIGLRLSGHAAEFSDYVVHSGLPIYQLYPSSRVTASGLGFNLTLARRVRRADVRCVRREVYRHC